MTIPKISVPGQRGYSIKRLNNSPIFLSLLFALVSVIGIAGKSLAESIVIDKGGTRLQVTDRNRNGPKPKLVLYTTMATWCVACKTELPQFLHLRSVFKPEELGMYGLPYDYKEGSERLKAWSVANGPPYELLTNLTKDNIASVKTMVIKTLRFDGVPASIITDTNGRILRMRWGPPSVSELRELLWSQNRPGEAPAPGAQRSLFSGP
jgi:thiol-disulfide isomerase/thioredoxin